MNSTKLYMNLAAVAGLVGIGMFLGHSLSQGTSNTPLWLGGMLVLLAAVLIGMSISSKKEDSSSKKSDTQE